MNTFATLALTGSIAFVTFGRSPEPVSPAVVSPADVSPADVSPELSAGGSVQLGSFSVSLNVKDIKASKAFYEKLDFKEVGGNIKQNWLILRHGTTTIGLFQGMFEKNSLTFNPGWNHEAEPLEEFQDVRELQTELKKRGLKLTTEADESSSGPAHFTLVDPDGNPILVDQHVAKPKSKSKSKK